MHYLLAELFKAEQFTVSNKQKSAFHIDSDYLLSLYIAWSTKKELAVKKKVNLQLKKKNK